MAHRGRDVFPGALLRVGIEGVAGVAEDLADRFDLGARDELIAVIEHRLHGRVVLPVVGGNRAQRLAGSDGIHQVV